MSYSSLKLPTYTFIVSSTSSINVTNSLSTTNGTNQLFDWVSINKTTVYPGEAYYRSGSGDYELASTATDYTAEVIGVVESVTACASSSLAKMVYYGKLTFDSSSIQLTDGGAYFLATSSANTFYNTGSVSFRNLTTSEPIISKPVFIAISNHEAIMVNYRGQANNNPWTSSYIVPQSLYDCHCTDVEPTPSTFTPMVEVYIGTDAPSF